MVPNIKLLNRIYISLQKNNLNMIKIELAFLVKGEKKMFLMSAHTEVFLQCETCSDPLIGFLEGKNN